MPRNHFRFREKILTEQAEWERERPVRPALDRVFRDRQVGRVVLVVEWLGSTILIPIL